MRSKIRILSIKTETKAQDMYASKIYVVAKAEVQSESGQVQIVRSSSHWDIDSGDYPLTTRKVS